MTKFISQFLSYNLRKWKSYLYTLYFQGKVLFNFLSQQQKYFLIKKKIQKKVKKNEKIKVGFYIIDDSVFPSRPLFEKMLDDSLFEPSIVVTPDTLRGEENMKSTLDKTYSNLSKYYEPVYLGYDKNSNSYHDFSEHFDLICFSNPYSEMTHEFFRVEHILNKNILPFHINYTFFGILKYDRKISQINSYNYFWKVFIENNYTRKELLAYQPLKGLNSKVLGYCKMDSLNGFQKEKSFRKTIVIAPHHTIDDDEKSLRLSNFLDYSDLFLELPKLYPQLDFIFRPHPLLFYKLCQDKFWGKTKTEEYFKKISSLPNVIYSKDGNYLDIFANSSGIIHDCGSFLAEYLFTGKPACYMLRETLIEETFAELGKLCLSHCYQAGSKEDILTFLNKVILQEDDVLIKNRLHFVERQLKINYPNVSGTIINYLKKELTA